MHPTAVRRIDRAFDRLTIGIAEVERVWTGGLWLEGPVYFRDSRQLLWSDIPRQRIMRLTDAGSSDVFRERSQHANGNTRDRQGRLVTCEHSGRRVTRTELDGRITVIADQFDGRALNSPNDVVVRSDGSIWFTDPDYGILGDYEGRRAPKEQDGSYVFRWDPTTAALDAVVTDMVQPNGLAFSTDETILYITDSGITHSPAGPKHVRAYDVVGGRTLTGGRLVLDIEDRFGDGLRIDEQDNLWVATGAGVLCATPDGTTLGAIELPEGASNCVFGGETSNRLFITATRSIYALYLNVRGAQTP
ncbi:SMP-30/gluconolactonase/LRE family protein [Ornithinimicrobium faecis]|uniref:SMP-30/gluconolactonase/LRE family protein n=1 Tax=Ornithinimicrobium faecis TaxID=2934158 RepID=A0ABY4YS07_9MICO|nr:SMP-30/gluconolactonase/LRE family protein [Ornithinimicrobium sp. HY1793]USQ79158.1 SMP-30/gluconolactonase/LRE family protein [Ornithinimicrobium sp. HY1793]